MIFRCLGAMLVCACFVFPQDNGVAVRVSLADRLGDMNIGRFGLGQAGVSPETMWSDRISEIRQLRLKTIRLFICEYFDLLPARGRYYWDTLDQSVDLILKTGAKPLLNIAFKPKVLFPAIDQDVVEPNNWDEWEALIYSLVRHYRDRGGKGWSWEVANEPDLQDGGGSPYHFTPENYAKFYQRTVSAILRADPEARVGGPALASWNSPILPALLTFCDSSKVPLHFVSWHCYSSDPGSFGKSIEGVKALLAKHPGLQPETVIDEWNMELGTSKVDPRFQPAFIAEITYLMKRMGLDFSCYFHIRDYPIAWERYLEFMPKENVLQYKLFWNEQPSYLGLFDMQSRVRPAYFLFKLLSRLSGTEVRAESDSPVVHALAATEESKTCGVLLWNFSKSSMHVTLEVLNGPSAATVRTTVLDSMAPNDDDTTRLRPLEPMRFEDGAVKLPLELEPYGVSFVSIEGGN
jgi:hypothetical protein